MISTMPQNLLLLLAGLIAILLNAPHPQLPAQGAALLVTLVCAIALWLAGNWRPR